MAGGHMTALAWAGIANAREEREAMRSLSDSFDDVSYERQRRQRMIERIRAEEQRAGKSFPAQKEDTYDRWAIGSDLSF